MSDSTFYPINFKFNYECDTSYRKQLRTFVSMNPLEPRMNEHALDDDEIDAVTNDENDYDEEAICKFLDKVSNCTSSNKEFQTLYLLAAGTMLSEDGEIGLAVLFSYSYLLPFHSILSRWFNDKSFGEEYTTLVTWFSTKRGDN